MQQDLSSYKKMLSDLIQKQMVILGPKISLDKARKIQGLELDESGQVTGIKGDPALVLKSLANEYMNLSGQIAKMTLDTLLEKYPGVKSV